jgi:O-antigen/teichoic acid export membrane protein
MSISAEVRSRLRLIRYTLSHGPWAFITSLSAGLSIYVIVILVAEFYGLAMGGQFRLLLSTIGILRLFTLIDSGKVLIKYLVQKETGVVRTLYLQKLRWSVMAMAIGLGIAGWYYSKGDEVWLPIFFASLCLPISSPASLYIQINQANKQFRLNAFYSVTKWGTVTLSVSVLAFLQVNSPWLMSTYFVLVALFNLLYLTRHEEVFESENENAPAYRRASLQLSGSGVFPVLVDNADKFLVSYFFGLEVLGLYVIGVSTGRLILNIVKPTLTIYFPLLVNHRFTPSLLIGGFLSLSALGIAAALLMRYYFEYILGKEYLAAYPLASIILVGLGVYFVGIVMYYSAVYHKDSSSEVPAISNVITAVVVVMYMVAALKLGGQYALLLCAASYPLRELVRIVVIGYLAARIDKAANTGAVQ